METITAKAIAMLVLGLGSFVTGMVPYWFSERARQRHPLLLSCLLCLGAGVLLSTSLVHMLPEASKNLPDYAELILCAGFFVVYLVDEIVNFFYGTQNDSNHMNYGSNERTNLLASDGELDVRERCCGDTTNPRMCHVSHKPPCNKSSSGILGLLVALFVHSVLEGLAIGVQESASQVLLLLGAVSCHKFVVGFCLGVELCASMAARLCAHIVSILVFSGGSVAGIAIGAGLGAAKKLEGTTEAALQAVAAGTLLYVTVSEVLPRERSRWHDAGRRGAGAAQLAAVVAGFGAMYLATVFLDHDST